MLLQTHAKMSYTQVEMRRMCDVCLMRTFFRIIKPALKDATLRLTSWENRTKQPNNRVTMSYRSFQIRVKTDFENFISEIHRRSLSWEDETVINRLPKCKCGLQKQRAPVDTPPPRDIRKSTRTRKAPQRFIPY